jgi:DNA-binding response OmpR family regulator
MALSQSQPARRVLVVEDEEAIRRGLLDVFAFHGYAPEGALRGDHGLELAREHDFDLVILDLMLPGLSGFELCRRLRGERPRLPILILSARGAEEDVLRAFRCGSDDYVTKPFSVAELVARASALLRRAASPARNGVAPPFSFAGWEIDPASLCGRRGDECVELTRREAELLHLFQSEPGRIVSRRRLLHELWGYPDPRRVETRTVDMHIAKLRRKLGPEGARIETVRGEGYRFAG